MNLNLVKLRFKKGFKTYDSYAFIQRKLAQILITYLKKVKNTFSSIVEIGAGTGILSSLIEKNLNFKTLILNDLVEESFFFLTEKLDTPFTFLAGNAENLKINADLIISSSAFQWFSNLENTLKNYNCNYLAFSLFLKDSLKELKNLFGVSLQYYSFEDIIQILKKLNYKILFSIKGKETLIFKDLFQALKYLKYTGVNSLSNSIIPLKTLKQKNKIFKVKYQRLTFSYGIFIAKREK